MTPTWRRLCPPVATATGSTVLVTDPRSGEIVLLVPGPAGRGESWVWAEDRFTITAEGLFGTAVDSVAAVVAPAGRLVFYGKDGDGLVAVPHDTSTATRVDWDGERANARLVAVTHVNGRLRVLLGDGTVLDERGGELTVVGSPPPAGVHHRVISGLAVPGGFHALLDAPGSLLDSVDRASWTPETGWTREEQVGDLRQLLPGGVVRTAKGWVAYSGEALPHPPPPEGVVTAVLEPSGTPFVLGATTTVFTGARDHPWGLRDLGDDWACATSGDALRVVRGGDPPELHELGPDGRWAERTPYFDPDLDVEQRDEPVREHWRQGFGAQDAAPEEATHFAPSPVEGVVVLDNGGHTWLIDDAGVEQESIAAPEDGLTGLRLDSTESPDLVRIAVENERVVLWHGWVGRAWTLDLSTVPLGPRRWQWIRSDGPRIGAAALCVSDAGTHLFAEGELWLLKRHGWQWIGGHPGWTARSLFVHGGELWSVGGEGVGRWNGAAFEVAAGLPEGGDADFVYDPAAGRVLAVAPTLGTSGLDLP